MASVLKVDKLDPQSGTALEIGTSGDTVSIPSGATLDISSATLTPPATMPASSGVNLTALNATNLGSGTVPTARLGTGTASSSTVLYGDQTYKAEPGGGKLLQVVTGTTAANVPSSSNSTSYIDTDLTVDITPSATSSKVLILVQQQMFMNGKYTFTGGRYYTSYGIKLLRDSTTLQTSTSDSGGKYTWQFQTSATDILDLNITTSLNYLDSPSSTSALTYKTQFASTNSNITCRPSMGMPSIITVLEIAA